MSHLNKGNTQFVVEGTSWSFGTLLIVEMLFNFMAMKTYWYKTDTSNMFFEHEVWNIIRYIICYIYATAINCVFVKYTKHWDTSNIGSKTLVFLFWCAGIKLTITGLKVQSFSLSKVLTYQPVILYYLLTFFSVKPTLLLWIAYL